MKKLSTLLFVLFLAGCQQMDTRAENPQPGDIQGKWEALNLGKVLSYGLLSFDSKGNGVFIAVNGEEAGLLLKVDSFKSKERSFQVTAHFIDEGERTDKAAVFEGELDQGVLCLFLTEENADEETKQPFCFSRYKEINKYRKMADQALNRDYKIFCVSGCLS